MSQETATHFDADDAKRRLKQPRMSDADGTREGGLVFVIVFIVGFIAATVAHPAAITSFWVWFVLLMMCVVIAVAVQKTAARLYGHIEDGEEEQ